MNILAERLAPPLRARLVECDCGEPACSTVFVVLHVEGARDLWLAVGLSLTGEIAAAEAADDILSNPMRDLGDYTLRQMVERGTALVGLPWGAYTSNEVLQAQIRAWSALPGWMERLPAGQLWAVRGVVFGRPLTFVPRALWAMGQSYVPDQPEAFEDFDQDLRWGLEVFSRGRAAVRMTRDVPVPPAVLLDMERWDA